MSTNNRTKAVTKRPTKSALLKQLNSKIAKFLVRLFATAVIDVVTLLALWYLLVDATIANLNWDGQQLLQEYWHQAELAINNHTNYQYHIFFNSPNYWVTEVGQKDKLNADYRVRMEDINQFCKDQKNNIQQGHPNDIHITMLPLTNTPDIRRPSKLHTQFMLGTYIENEPNVASQSNWVTFDCNGEQGSMFILAPICVYDLSLHLYQYIADKSSWMSRQGKGLAGHHRTHCKFLQNMTTKMGKLMRTAWGYTNPQFQDAETGVYHGTCHAITFLTQFAVIHAAIYDPKFPTYFTKIASAKTTTDLLDMRHGIIGYALDFLFPVFSPLRKDKFSDFRDPFPPRNIKHLKYIDDDEHDDIATVPGARTKQTQRQKKSNATKRPRKQAAGKPMRGWNGCVIKKIGNDEILQEMAGLGFDAKEEYRVIEKKKVKLRRSERIRNAKNKAGDGDVEMVEKDSSVEYNNGNSNNGNGKKRSKKKKKKLKKKKHTGGVKRVHKESVGDKTLNKRVSGAGKVGLGQSANGSAKVGGSWVRRDGNKLFLKLKRKK